MGVPSLLQGFGKIGANPISRIALEREKVKKNRISSGVGVEESGKGLVESVRVIENQFQFDPSFDQHLKAMESVKPGRSRDKHVIRVDEEKDYSNKSSYLETSNGKIAKSSYLENMSKLDYEENDSDLSTEWELGEGEDDDEVASHSNVTQGTTKYHMRRGSYRNTRTISEVDSNEGGFDEKSKYTNMQKTSNTERVTDFKGVNKWVRERKQSYDTSIGRTARRASESSLDRTLNHWETTSNSGSEMEQGETRIWKRKSTPQISEVDRQIHDYNISERKSSYGIERNVSVPEREKRGFGSSTAHLELDRNYSRVGDTRSIKSGNFAKGSKLLKEEEREDDKEMERAAFKSFEVFTDLRGTSLLLQDSAIFGCNSLCKFDIIVFNEE